MPCRKPCRLAFAVQVPESVFPAFAPAVEGLEDGEWHPVSVLYREGVSVGAYGTPVDALERINDDILTGEYLALVSESDEPPSVSRQ